MENVEILGEMRLKSGQTAEDIITLLTNYNYLVARKSIGLIYNEYEILRKKDTR